MGLWIRIDTHTHTYICYVHTIHGISKSSSTYRIQEPINVANCTMKPYHFLRLITSLQRAAVSLSLSLCIYIYTRIYVSTIDTYGCIYILTIYLYMYDWLYIFTLHAHTHTHTHTHAHKHTPTHTHIYIYILHIYIYIYILYTHTHTHIYIYIYIYIYLHIYIYIRMHHARGWLDLVLAFGLRPRRAAFDRKAGSSQRRFSAQPW